MELRRDNTTLPQAEELKKVLETEVYYPLPPGKETTHYPEFQTIIAAFSALDIDTTLFTHAVSDIHEAVRVGGELLPIAAGRFAAAGPEFASLFGDMYDYLAEEDAPLPSDLIITFGAKTPLRAELAAELYHQGLAPRVLLTGGNPIYAHGEQESEAQRYAEIMVTADVPRDALILEEHAITVPDNVRRSLTLLDELGLSPRSIIIVSSPYSQRRSWALLKKHLSDEVAIYRVNSGTKFEFARDQWYRNEATARVVINEFIKMRASVIYNTA